MSGKRNGSVCIDEEFDIVTVRKAVREASMAIGFEGTDVTRIVTASSELARNVFHFAGSGKMRWHELKADRRAGIELTFEDKGPGIANIKQAKEMGYSTGKGLGMGVPGAERLMGEMEIQSKVGEGTTVTVRKWLSGV